MYDECHNKGTWLRCRGTEGTKGTHEPNRLLKNSPGEGTGPTRPVISEKIMWAACPHASFGWIFQQAAKRLLCPKNS